MTFIKGQRSANPKGAPKRQETFTFNIKRALDKPIEELRVLNDDIVKNPKCKMTGWEAIGVRMAIKILEGDSRIVKEFAERIEGKVPQPIQGGETGSPPIIIKVTSEDGSTVQW